MHIDFSFIFLTLRNPLFSWFPLTGAPISLHPIILNRILLLKTKTRKGSFYRQFMFLSLKGKRKYTMKIVNDDHRKLSLHRYIHTYILKGRCLIDSFLHCDKRICKPDALSNLWMCHSIQGKRDVDFNTSMTRGWIQDQLPRNLPRNLL